MFFSINPDHADGRVSSRSVCPVGAVSKITWSNTEVALASPKSRENSSNAAISSVQEPENCSSMLAIAVAGSCDRYGPTIRSRYSAADFSGSRFIAESPGTEGTGVG